MLDALRSGAVDALVLECGFVEWISSYQCDLQMVRPSMLAIPATLLL